MAIKKPSPLEDPPAASSSEEEVSEEEVESDEEEESEEEEEAKTEQKQQHPTKKSASTSIPPPPTTTTTTPAVDKKASKKPETQPQSSSEESGSESESESDHPPPGVADPNVKPIASKPMDDASKLKTLKKPRSKPTASASVVASPSKSAAKRPVENSGTDGKDSKRAKKKGAAEANGDAVETAEKEKKPLFQRLWSEDDEIVILKGIMDFTSKKGADPIAELDVFHDFIKKSLHIDVTRTQLMEKMRRLRKKYENNAGKGKNGADRTFSKPHEQKAFDLSKKVWGIQANNGVRVDQAAKSNGNAKKSQKIDKRLTQTEKEELLASLRGPKDAPPKEDTKEQISGPEQVSNETIRLHQKIVAAGLDAPFMLKGLSLITGDKRSELDEKWRELLIAETEIFLRRIDLVREQTKLVLDAYKKNQSL